MILQETTRLALSGLGNSAPEAPVCSGGSTAFAAC